MKTLKLTALALVAATSLLACKPAFETTSQKCESGQEGSVFANYLSFEVKVDPQGNVISADGNRVEADANGIRTEVDIDGNLVSDNPNEYRLYLQDILSAMTASAAIEDEVSSEGEVTISAADKITAVNAIVSRFNERMPYTIENGVITSADNPIDFIESLITTTNGNEVIQSFVDAKSNLAAGINDNDDFCIFTNKNIVLNKVELETNGDVKTILQQIFAELRMTFDPFNDFFSQNIILTNEQADFIDLTKRTETPFVGFYESIPSDFKAQGFSKPRVRFASMNSPSLTETFDVDDDFEMKLGQLEFTTFNTFCSEADENGALLIIPCTTGLTHTVTKDQCNGGFSEEGVAQVDETGKMQVRTIDLVPGNSDLSGIQRFRLETDYKTGEVRVYVSRFTEAILDADAVQEVGVSNVIINPTTCEKQAVLDDLVLIEGIDENSTGVRLTGAPDAGYDVVKVLDSDGNRIQDSDGNDLVIEPIPIFTYQGTTIPARQ